MFSLAFPTFILSLVLVALADPTPSEPNPGNVFKEGNNITATWTPDTSGVWKTMNIQLMTGDNFQMVPLTTVGTVDGTTSPGTYSFACPAVTIHAPIYFLQFSIDATHIVWTGRFTITDASGAIVSAPNATQPNGQAIPWGTGALVDPAKATPPPSYLPGGSAVGSNASTVTPVSNAGTSTTSSVASTSTPGGNTPLDVGGSGTTNNTNSGTTTSSPAAASSGSSDKSSSAANSGGALVLGAVSARAAQVGVALAVVAGTFTFLM
ncbi:hypothetical protein BC827DRAFT_1371344 [Russula dissimulans]|nr:hypothetical protein BC827DRAFT_1371344 [Russula dissimulans]